jgi:hypothetical protein
MARCPLQENAGPNACLPLLEACVPRAVVRKCLSCEQVADYLINFPTLTLAISSKEFPCIDLKRTLQLIRRRRKGHAALVGTLALKLPRGK